MIALGPIAIRAVGPIQGAPQQQPKQEICLPCIKLVDGDRVREKEVEFTMGGHGLVYPNLIPPNEIWVEAALNEHDRKCTAVHEVLEYCLMYFFKWEYNMAHKFASVVEAVLRRRFT